jgi:hypothetical protein
MANQGEEEAVEAFTQAVQMLRAAMAADPGLNVIQPDVEKLSMKVAKYYGYDQEMKLAMQRQREQMRMGGPPPQGGPPGQGGGGPAGPPPM